MRNNWLKAFYPLLFSLFVLLTLQASAQQKQSGSDPSITQHGVREVPVFGVINASEIQEDWGGVLKNSSTIHQPGVDLQKDEFLRLKAAANQAKAEAIENGTYPLSGYANKTQVADPPVVGNNFFANGNDGSIPNDNALAVGLDGKTASATNAKIYVFSETGTTLLNTSLNSFSNVPGINNNFKFDPKIVYDPVADRFILVFLNGASPNSSQVVVCFSQSGDPTGNWNFYGLSGNVIGNVWTDFPQIGLSNDELFITGNLFDNNDNAQGSAVWQIEKADGYAGNSLTVSTLSTPYFSLHPVQGGATLYGPAFYLIRNVNSGGSANVWVHKMTNTIANGGVLNSPVSLVSNLSYTLGPDANQKNSATLLQTNDCRIQSSYLENNRIEFVFNSGLGGVPSAYYGTIQLSPFDLNFSLLTATYVSFPDIEIGYPAIAYAGIQGVMGYNASLISFNYSSPTHYTGSAAVYANEDGDISDWVNLRVGSGPIGQGAQWRWGDYSDICERANNPGEAWVGGSYATGSGFTRTYISQIFRPGLVGTEPVEPTIEEQVSIYPIPSQDMVTLDFPVSQSGDHFLKIYDTNGKLVKEVISHFLRKGEGRLSFYTNPLPDGVYFVTVTRGEEQVLTEKFVVQK